MGCRFFQVHSVSGLLARFHRPAEDDLHQEALRYHQASLPVPVWLDGCRPAFRVQADAWELNHLFRALDEAEKAGDTAKAKEIEQQIDNHETHVVPIIADIDAGFGNAEATYLLAKQMIEAGACCIQIE